jgi:hypothetical protein
MDGGCSDVLALRAAHDWHDDRASAFGFKKISKIPLTKFKIFAIMRLIKGFPSVVIKRVVND